MIAERKTVSQNLTVFNVTTPKRIELRDYQKKAVKQVWHYLYKLNLTSSLLFAPTGSGKTVIAGELMVRVVTRLGQRCLFAVHRERLLSQTKETMISKYGIRTAIIGVDSKEEIAKAEILVGLLQSIQGIALQNLPKIGMLILDEAHTISYWKSARRLIDHYSGGLFFQSKVKVLGLSATPRRAKYIKEGYCWLYQSLVRCPGINQLIKKKHLASFRHFGWGGMINPSELEIGASGEFTERSVKKVCTEDFYREVAKTYVQTCPDRQAIAFCSDVAMAKQFAEILKDMGIPAAALTGQTPTANKITQQQREEGVEDRETIVEKYERGDYWVLTNPKLLTEGYDSPFPRAVILAAPINVPANMIQMGGRGARLNKEKAPEKTDCWLLDFCGNIIRNELYIDGEFPIGFCPTGRKSKPNPDLGKKECPDCQEILSAFARVCPHCGYIFGDIEEEEEEIEKPDKFGEMLSPERQIEVRWLRTQLKRAHTQKKPPTKVYFKFYEKYKYFPPDYWARAVIFSRYSREKVESYRLYLHQTIPSLKPSVEREWIKREFGKVPQDLRWWEILNVDRDCHMPELASSYKCLYQHFADSPRLIRLINAAFDIGRAEIEVKIDTLAPEADSDLP